MTTHEEIDVPKKGYIMKRKEFRRDLVLQLQLLGFVLIIVSQLKFAGSIVLFIVRLLVQSLLSAPFPSEERMVRFMMYYRESSRGNSREGTDVNASLRQSFRKIESMFVYATVVVNFGVMVCDVVWPMDFEKMVEGFLVPGMESGNLGSYGSPFNHGTSRVIEGELRRHWFTQYIGERVPRSNLWGNMSYMGWQWAILVVQAGLCLTVEAQGEALQQGSPQGSPQVSTEGPPQALAEMTGPEIRSSVGVLDDEYNGNVMVMEMDPLRTVRTILRGADSGADSGADAGAASADPRNVDEMV